MMPNDPIMVTVTLMTVEPTDRALTGWMPFSPGWSLIDEFQGWEGVLHELNITGAGSG